VTSQTRDFDADLDFDRFGMTGFFEAGVLRTSLRMSSSLSGFREIGFAFAMALIQQQNQCPLTKFSIYIHTTLYIATFSHILFRGWRACYSVTPLTSAAGNIAS